MTEGTPSQQQAIAARGNVLVVAGAGTGKTSTLVQRCVALLEEGCSLEHILMVTFTDAAAAEMRRRIREALLERAKRIESLPAADSTGTLREHFDKQLALLDTANISTLHSFCLRLATQHFYELGIDPVVTVLDEQQTQPLIQQTLDALFERNYAGETAAAKAVQSLVRVQGAGVDERIQALVLKLYRYSQSLANPERWLNEQLVLFHQTEPDQWRAWFIEGFQDWSALWLPALKPFADTPAVGLCITALTGVPDNPTVTEVAEAVQALKVLDDTDEHWPHGSKTNVRDPLKNFFADAEFLCSLTPVPGSDPLAEDWGCVRHQMIALLSLVKDFTAEFSRAKRELGGVDFADLEQFALRVLREPKTGELTPTAAHWRAQFEHVFVDEYQDINAAQDAILTALSREGSEANRFLVGDVKQSIYRFRLAAPAIFRGYEQRWSSGAAHAQRIPLADNFRSRAAILNFINSLFSTLMREEIGGVAYLRLRCNDATARTELSGETGELARVELHLIAKGNAENGEANAGEEESKSQAALSDLLATEREARLVAMRLRELHRQQHEIWDKDQKNFRPVEYSDMAVLVRSPAGRVEAFAMEFNRLGVPLVAARGGFFESTEISDLLCLLKLIDNPLQDIPLLAVLRSPLVGLSLDELAEVRASNREPSFWLTLRRFHRQSQSAEANEQRIASAWRKVDLFLRQFEVWRELIRQTSLSHCLETALAETHYEDLLGAEPRGEVRLANIRRLLELARQYDPYQRQGLFRFLQFIEAQEELETAFDTAPPSSGNAVQLMSIHKSKGLEFPVVALAGLGWQFNLQDLREDILLDEKYGICPKVAPLEGERRYPSLPYWLARQRQRRELLGEELRLLYVAMTRARDTLILTATAPGKGDPKWTSTDKPPLSDRQILSARSFLGWLQLWLPLVTQEADWTSGRDGQSNLLRWTIYSENDPRLVLPPDLTSAELAETVEDLDESALKDLGERILWQYPFGAATKQRAKMTVTELRRHSSEEADEAEAARFVRRNVFADSTRRDGSLTAAEVGTAHHVFLEYVPLEKVGSAFDLKNEAARMQREGILSTEEAAVLKFKELAAFWQSELGCKIRAQDRKNVHRELPFWARLSRADLAELELLKEPGLPDDEFIVVQGVMDLAVILSNEIWLVDFKTDHLIELELPVKVRQYAPQLKLYSLALSRIYRRPVQERWLHWLALGKTVRV